MARRLVYAGSLNGTGQILRPFMVNNTQTIYRGDIVVMSGGKASIAADAASSGTVIGVSDTDIVTTTAAATDIILVDVNPASIYEAPYTGSAAGVSGTLYDMGTAAYEVDLDDTTGGWLQLYPQFDGSVKNTTKTTCLIVITNRLFGLA